MKYGNRTSEYGDFFKEEDGIRGLTVTGVQTCALPISLADTARLLRLRGEAMQAAVAPGEGAMAALIGIDIAGAEKAIAETDAALGVCEIANDNAPGQVVVSGAKARVEATVEASKKHGAKIDR